MKKPPKSIVTPEQARLRRRCRLFFAATCLLSAIGMVWVLGFVAIGFNSAVKPDNPKWYDWYAFGGVFGLAPLTTFVSGICSYLSFDLSWPNHMRSLKFMISLAVCIMSAIVSAFAVLAVGIYFFGAI